MNDDDFACLFIDEFNTFIDDGELFNIVEDDFVRLINDDTKLIDVGDNLIVDILVDVIFFT